MIIEKVADMATFFVYPIADQVITIMRSALLMLVLKSIMDSLPILHCGG